MSGRVTFGATARPTVYDAAPLLASQLKALRAREYSDAIEAGFKITLDLLLGEAVYGGDPYTGPLPDELREWAEAARARLARS